MKAVWKKTLGLAVLSVCAAQLQGGQDGGLSPAVDRVSQVESEQSGIKLNGYVDVGYTYNFTGGAAPSFAGYSADAGRAGDFNLNALKLTLEKDISPCNTLQAGFRVDVMAGEDAQGLAGAAPGSNGLYVQQAYALLRVPVGAGLDIEMGKYSSLLGYEADERPANLNITGGINSWQDPGPAPGVLLSYPLNANGKVYLGVTNGSGSDGNSGENASNEGYAVSGAYHLKNPGGNVEAQWSFQYAPQGDPASFEGDGTDLLGLNQWASWQPRCADGKLLLACNSSVWTAQGYRDPVTGRQNGSSFYTGALYAKYSFCDCMALAARAEYAHADDTNLLSQRGGGSDDLWSWTVTPTFNLATNLLLRLEYRLQWGDDVTGNAGKSAHTLAAETVFSF